MKRLALKAKRIIIFGHLQNVVRLFQRLTIVSSLLFRSGYYLILQNYYIKLKLYVVNGEANTELHHKAILRVSIRKLGIYMLNKYSTGFSTTYDLKGLVGIFYCSI